MKHLLYPILAVLLLTGSCKTQTDGFVINGLIEDVLDSTLVILYAIDEQVCLDSSFTVNGEFVFKGVVEQPIGCWIRCEEESANIQLENTLITFKSTIKKFGLDSQITGGKEQDLQNELKNLQKPYEIVIEGALDSIMNHKYPNDSIMQELFNRYNDFQNASQEIYINYGVEHSDSYYGLNIVYMNRKSIPKDTLREIYQSLPADLMETQNAMALKAFLYDRSVEVGKPFVDFEVKTIYGEAFQLSSLNGKYIFLSFWSAGCGPCRMENKHISKHFSEVPENLEIVSFYADKNVEIWKEASEVDKIDWYNVSDGEGSNGRIKTQYQVQAIPASFLIDKEGIVVESFKGFDNKRNLIQDLSRIIAELESAGL